MLVSETFADYRSGSLEIYAEDVLVNTIEYSWDEALVTSDYCLFNMIPDTIRSKKKR